MPAHITEYKMRQFTYNIKKAKIALHKLQIYLIGKPWWIGNQDQTAIITFSITRNGNETPSVMGLDTGDDVFVVASRTIGVLYLSTIMHCGCKCQPFSWENKCPCLDYTRAKWGVSVIRYFFFLDLTTLGLNHVSWLTLKISEAWSNFRSFPFTTKVRDT